MLDRQSPARSPSTSTLAAVRSGTACSRSEDLKTARDGSPHELAEGSAQEPDLFRTPREAGDGPASLERAATTVVEIARRTFDPTTPLVGKSLHDLAACLPCDVCRS